LVGFEGFIEKALKASHLYLCDMERGPSKTFKTYQRPSLKTCNIRIGELTLIG
jgi:hypothetical protein